MMSEYTMKVKVERAHPVRLVGDSVSRIVHTFQVGKLGAEAHL